MSGNEYHFQVIGKWGVERWFRIPEALYHELVSLRCSSPFVFGAYIAQLREFHAPRPGTLKKVSPDFDPKNFGRWFYERVVEWSCNGPKGPAFVHLFRKTTLQHARRGEDINLQIAHDARISEAVLMSSYVRETDEELRQRSNRTFLRIVASLPAEVARRYGYFDAAIPGLEERLKVAIEAKDWALVAALSARLAPGRRPEAG